MNGHLEGEQPYLWIYPSPGMILQVTSQNPLKHVSWTIPNLVNNTPVKSAIFGLRFSSPRNLGRGRYRFFLANRKLANITNIPMSLLSAIALLCRPPSVLAIRWKTWRCMKKQPLLKPHLHESLCKKKHVYVSTGMCLEFYFFCVVV